MQDRSSKAGKLPHKRTFGINKKEVLGYIQEQGYLLENYCYYQNLKGWLTHFQNKIWIKADKRTTDQQGVLTTTPPLPTEIMLSFRFRLLILHA